MPTGVYPRIPGMPRTNKHDIAEFVKFVYSDDHYQIISSAEKPHVAAAELYRQSTNKNINTTVARRALAKYKAVKSNDGNLYVIEKKLNENSSNASSD